MQLDFVWFIFTSNPTSADKEFGLTLLMKMPGFCVGPLEILEQNMKEIKSLINGYYIKNRLIIFPSLQSSYIPNLIW